MLVDPEHEVLKTAVSKVPGFFGICFASLSTYTVLTDL